eukprot:scaffold48100_cov45-Phaeocystis_antarctica.AAC.1
MRAPWAAAGARGASGAPPGASPMLRGVGFLRPGGARFDAVSRMPVQACAAPRQARAAGGSAAPEADFSLDLTQVSEAASRVGGTPGASPATPAAPAAAPAAPIAPGAEAQPPTPPELPSGRGVARVLKFLEQLKPPSSSSAPPPPPSVREHLTEAPMLLPSIIFQDLVFGADLGSGSFSTVRAHARTHTRHTHTHNCFAVCIRACTTTRGHSSSRHRAGALLQAHTAGGADSRVARVRRQGDPRAADGRAGLRGSRAQGDRHPQAAAPPGRRAPRLVLPLAGGRASDPRVRGTRRPPLAAAPLRLRGARQRAVPLRRAERCTALRAQARPPRPHTQTRHTPRTRHSDGAPRPHRTSHHVCHPRVSLALTCCAPTHPLPSPPRLGFAFGDLKPENILLTASGHAKLTDFGAARPLPGHAAAIAALASAGNVILELRDGDWRAKRQATAAPAGTEGAQGGGG